MINFKLLINQLILSGKNNYKFIKLPYTNFIYNICIILYKEYYIKNFIYYTSKIDFKTYIIIELLFLNTLPKLNKIISFNYRLKINYKKYKDLLKLKNKSGLFIINTSKGIMSLSETLLCKCGGIILLYIL